MGFDELIKSIGGAGILVVLSASWIYKVIFMDPREKEKQNSLIERVSSVIANNTEVIRETKTIHREMEKTIVEMKHDIEEIKRNQDNPEIKSILERLESKVDALGKE